MTDYKELAARLRRKAPLLDYSHAAMDYIAAADAIEALLNVDETNADIIRRIERHTPNISGSIVRCKDCKYFYREISDFEYGRAKIVACNLHKRFCKPSDFCSCGVRDQE